MERIIVGITDHSPPPFNVEKEALGHNAEIIFLNSIYEENFDPIINDHYADSLWMNKKKIQARYFWKHVLSLKEVEQKLIDKIEKKLIFGVI